jgi:hypothetical protein
VSGPELVFRPLREAPPDPFSLIWLVTIADGQTYYVIDEFSFLDIGTGGEQPSSRCITLMFMQYNLSL